MVSEDTLYSDERTDLPFSFSPTKMSPDAILDDKFTAIFKYLGIVICSDPIILIIFPFQNLDTA